VWYNDSEEQERTGGESLEEWEKLRGECEQCHRCPLGERRQNLVFGDGNPSADLMLVGEGPGEQEDRTGIPFVGPAGKLLDQMLEIIDLDRSRYYIANIVKCRPPGNRDPREEEQAACMDYLRAQVRLVKPRVIVCLGRIAAQRLIRKDYRITREHGQWVQAGPFWMTAIYHPSALLRDVSKRPETFDDLMAIQAKLRELGIQK
jgi:DNA polymerase